MGLRTRNAYAHYLCQPHTPPCTLATRFVNCKPDDKSALTKHRQSESDLCLTPYEPINKSINTVTPHGTQDAMVRQFPSWHCSITYHFDLSCPWHTSHDLSSSRHYGNINPRARISG